MAWNTLHNMLRKVLACSDHNFLGFIKPVYDICYKCLSDVLDSNYEFGNMPEIKHKSVTVSAEQNTETRQKH